MSQNWDMPVGTDVLSSAIKTNIVDALGSLRSLFAGAAEPSSKEAYMLWADTTNGQLKMRNASNTAWDVVGALHKDHGKIVVNVWVGTVNATTTFRIMAAPDACTIERIVLISDTATTGSVAATTEWTFMLDNATATLNLFSATPSTATFVSGVGGGAEIAVDTAYILTPNQNQSPTKDDVLRFIMTKVGAPANLNQVVLQLEFTVS